MKSFKRFYNFYIAGLLAFIIAVGVAGISRAEEKLFTIEEANERIHAYCVKYVDGVYTDTENTRYARAVYLQCMSEVYDKFADIVMSEKET